MKKIFINFSFIFLLSLLVFSCSIKPQYPDIPHIEYVSLSNNYANEFDTLWVKLRFEDGDGNLGRDVNTHASCVTNCEYLSDSSCFKDPYFGAFLIDMRDSCFVYHKLPDFEPDGKIKAVSGDILLNIPPLFCKNGTCTTCTEDTVVYKIILRDASGNLSNSVLTDTIYLNCN